MLSRVGYDSYVGAASAMRRLEAVMGDDASIREKLERAPEFLNQNET